MSEISVAVNSLVETNNLLRLDMRKLATMDSMMKDILRATKALQSGDRDQERLNDPVQALSLAVSSLGVHGRTIAYEQDLLGSLHFPMIQARHEKIEQAHANTYEWVFRDSMPGYSKPIRFVEWLEEGNGIFWIHGKPGCGKSTLMKFICNHAQTRKHLSHWAESYSKSLEELHRAEARWILNTTQAQVRRAYGDDGDDHAEEGRLLPMFEEEKRLLRYEATLIKSYNKQQSGGDKGKITKLVTLRYFFWNAGSRLQKSQEGLLRSLLFEVLRQCPELIGHVRRTRSRYRGLADKFGETGSFAASAPWSSEELLLTLQDVIRVRMSATFCLFIDGLDEYEEENKETYRHIAKSPNAKVCASSRPWTVFLDAFRGVSTYSLKLEDLTRGDIRRYVSDKFQEHDQYRRLKAHDPAYEDLIQEVSTQARGVFLWVYLVVKDLLEGLTYNYSVQTMLQRLHQFPEDLEDFFMHMIECIPPLYRRQAARTFIITMAAPEPLLLTLHSFLDDIEADPRFCLNRAQLPFGTSELAFRHERMRRQLEGRTKGLLEVVSGSETTVPYFVARIDFLHRTVRDFLHSSSKMQSFMTSGQDAVSDTWVLLCRGILAEIRYAPFQALPRSARAASASSTQQQPATSWLHKFLAEFVYFADKALQGANNKSVIISLCKAVETANTMAKAEMEDTSDRFPELVCQHGLLELLKEMDYDWSKLSDPIPNSMPLIRSALMHFNGASQLQHNVVEYLLGSGADPNQCWEGRSHFQEYMAMLYVAEPAAEAVAEQERHAVFQIVAALAAHGADMLALIDNQERATSVQSVIYTYFPPDTASRLLDNASAGEGSHRQLSTSSGERLQVPSSPQAPGRRASLRLKLRGLLGRRGG